MFLENVVGDATDPRTLGRFWEAVLGTETLTDEPAGYETRLEVPDGPVLDLCFQRVPTPPSGPRRLRWGLRDDVGRHDRLLELGATRARGQDGVWFADPAGNPFSVVADPAYADTGPVVVLSLDVADPDRELVFWAWLTGWRPTPGAAALRHPSQRGPVLELRLEPEPKRTGKNQMHLDIRLEPGDDHDALAREIVDRGGAPLHTDWGDLPWRCYLDLSGNEFCLLPSR
ncbi:VOC family protein [Nocardioides insulae]|uniref:VOC family protein n=1 Tax=Nocardioides insulae TaxID=394734 RepID=UPI00042A731A|nr:VOC family protein [Nocardioides insulae]